MQAGALSINQLTSATLPNVGNNVRDIFLNADVYLIK
jgi:hypothetical protein